MKSDEKSDRLLPLREPGFADPASLGENAKNKLCILLLVRGISLVVKHEFSKLGSGVRFSHPAHEVLRMQKPAHGGLLLSREKKKRYLTASFSVFEARNFGTRIAAIWIT